MDHNQHAAISVTRSAVKNVRQYQLSSQQSLPTCGLPLASSAEEKGSHSQQHLWYNTIFTGVAPILPFVFGPTLLEIAYTFEPAFASVRVEI
jgi:hypothetical protein